jgi:cytochrome c biogenesis protein CcmG/thiol:disulfide interchange protein DsbE
VSRKTIYLALALVLTLGLFVFTGCSSEADKSETTPPATEAAAAPGAVGKGHPAPDFSLRKLSGGELQLSSLKGKVVLVDFWDTWCPPCRKALPHLQELSETYGDDLVVVGVALGREGEAKVRSYVEANHLTFEMVLFNNDMKLIDNFGGVEGIPTTFLIDDAGIIREKWVGGFGKETYENGIKALLGS